MNPCKGARDTVPDTTRGYAPLAVALQAAIAAGDYFRSRRDSIHDVRAKTAPSDLVTDVDPVCEEMIRRHIQSHYPDDTVLGEETTAPGSAASSAATAAVWDAPQLWIVDPLDGTTNFVQGLPLSVVSVAYACSGRLQAGVVYDPLRDECFTALKGGGAFLNGSPARVDTTRKNLKEALLVTGYPSDRRFNERLHRINYHRVVESCANLRALGAAALELAYVACGRLTGFWENTLRPWDIAAGSLLVAEAGGRVTDIDGGPVSLSGYPSIAASNGHIHRELLMVLAQNFENRS
ncbi:MAG: inositol monophosphatase [Alicyclobacillus sp.]|nr:inositol monophosphatase [Alicyclobacillus sp.]